jgi:hypothetical protein
MSISTTRPRLDTGTPCHYIPDTKQSYYTVRLAGASLFLVGEDATSQLRTPFTNNIHLFNKRLPFNPLSFSHVFQHIHLYFRSVSLLFPPFLVRFPFTKTIRLIAKAPPLLRFVESVLEREKQSTTYKRQTNNSINSP